jgi:hypothetical protein
VSPRTRTNRRDLDLVRASLQHYAARGAFRSFSEIKGRGRRAAFRFHWFRDVAFTVTYDPDTRVLTFVDALPAVPSRSAMDKHLRRFVASRSAASVPEHRRFDLKKVTVHLSNRRGAVAFAFTLTPRHVEYGVQKASISCTEVLMDFLNEPQYVEYNIDHFNLNPEMA